MKLASFFSLVEKQNLLNSSIPFNEDNKKKKKKAKLTLSAEKFAERDTSMKRKIKFCVLLPYEETLKNPRAKVPETFWFSSSFFLPSEG